jgi:hypothetical protein
LGEGGRGFGANSNKKEKKFAFRNIFVTEVQKGLNTRRPTIVFFLVLTNLSHHVIRHWQARSGDTMLVKSTDMTGRTQTLPWWLGGG